MMLEMNITTSWHNMRCEEFLSLEYFRSVFYFQLRKIEENDDTIDLLKTNTKRLEELTELVDEKRHLDEQLISRKTKAVCLS